MPIDESNPYGVGYTTQRTEVATAGPSDFKVNRVHKIINPTKLNPASGMPVAYAIVSPMKQMLLAHPTSWHARRAKYAQHPYWVTQHRDDELYAAGNYTYQSFPVDGPTDSATADRAGGGENMSRFAGDLGSWAARKDDVRGRDIVIWHSISLTHNPRVEDYPVMPADTMTVALKPSGFFDRNPALDVPQSLQAGRGSGLFEGGGGDCCAVGGGKL